MRKEEKAMRISRTRLRKIMACHEKWILLIWFATTLLIGPSKCHLLLSNREFGARLSALHNVPTARSSFQTSAQNRTDKNSPSTTPSPNLVKSVDTSSSVKNISYVWHYMFDDDKHLQGHISNRDIVAKNLNNRDTNHRSLPKVAKTVPDSVLSKKKTVAERRLDESVHNALMSLLEEEENDYKRKTQKLVPSPNLYFNKIEPFWPFSNFSSNFFEANGFDSPPVDKGPSFNFPFANLPDRFKDTTFFFSHVGPNSFEYRAQFHHGGTPPKPQDPYVGDPLPELLPKIDFPKITFPKFPQFPEEPELIRRQPQFPDFFADPVKFQFPEIPPPVRYDAPPANKDGNIDGPRPNKNTESDKPRGRPDRKFDRSRMDKNDNFVVGPFNDDNGYDIVLGAIHTKYPKIFRFNDERINIQDFEKHKKLVGLNNLLLAEPDNVQRQHLLILHGGIFTVKEPPLFQKKVIRKRKQRMFHSNRISKH